MINGRDGDDILNDATTSIDAAAGQKVVIRPNAVGYQPAMVKLDGLAFDVLASNGRPLAKTSGTTSLMALPGQR
jgi:FtsP/CotA-like multicopper oxidase with cupredoxin domain